MATDLPKCGLCADELRSGENAAAFRGGMAHLGCWIDWRAGRMSQPRPHVLVIDDDEATRYATRRVLEHAGFIVTEAPTAACAMEAVEARPDVVLVDVKLPDLDGFAVCRRIKSDPDTAWMKVVPFTAAFVAEADRARALSAGAHDYLVKPVPPAKLVATLRSAVGIR